MAISYTKWIESLFWKSENTGAPLSGTFELTARCNLDCKMCYIHKKANDMAVRKQELSAQQWIALAKGAKEKGMLLLLLTGGEPLLRSDFKEIYQKCHDMGLLISLNTNGTLLNQEMVEFLKESPPLRVNITLYGASKESYKALCADESAYERAYQAVSMLREAGIRVKINYSAMPQNVKDIPVVYQFAREQGLPLQVATYMFPPVRACEFGECSADRMSAEQAGKLLWNYDKLRFPEEILEKRIKAMLAGEVVSNHDQGCQELPTERIRCRAGSTTFWLTFKGEMRPCGMMRIPSVNLMKLGFNQAWKTIRQERENIMIPAKCTACRWKNACEFCPATCYAENGTFEKAPEYICEKTKTYLNSGKEWLESFGGKVQNENK